MDDQRNTDDAWVETVTWHFHDETRETLGDFEFEVGVDKCLVTDLDEGLQIYF